jgi:hypothetical protein
LHNDDDYSVAEIAFGENKRLLIAQANKNFDPNKKHSFNKGNVHLEWTGPFSVN